MLSRILQADGRGLTMIFARTKRTVAKVAEELADRHFAAAAVHGDLGQGAREQALRAFRNGKVDVLVATDVAARGIDVEGVTHVINFQCPEDEKVYTHRIGRTGRAGATGTAITLVDWDEVPRWQLINKALDLSIPEPPELYSTSPQLYADLGIPEGVKGVLPRQDRVREGLDAEQIEDIGETGRHQAKPARRGARDKDAPAAARAERPARTPRQRTRTRGGVKLGAEGQGEALLLLEETEPATGSAAESDEVVLDAATEVVPRRRNRTRKSAASGRGGGSVKLEPGSLAGPSASDGVVTGAVATDTMPKVPAPATSLDVVPAKDAESGEQAAPARKRTRARKAAAPATAADADGGADNAATGTATGSAVGSDEEDLNIGPVANPRRTRLRPPRNRTRKGASVTPAADADEQAAG
jgi:superfamily II DNA/RNA helicase